MLLLTQLLMARGALCSNIEAAADLLHAADLVGNTFRGIIGHPVTQMLHAGGVCRSMTCNTSWAMPSGSAGYQTWSGELRTSALLIAFTSGICCRLLFMFNHHVGDPRMS